MASRRKYRLRWLRWQKQYERLAYRELQKTFHAWSANIPFDSLTEFNYKMEIKLAITQKLMSESYYRIYKGIGVKHGKRVGRSINRELKDFIPDKFLTVFLNNINKYLARYGLAKVRTVQDTYFEEIVKLFNVRLDEGMTIEQAQREIRRIVNKPNFYRLQAIRIARTETTAAANFAATQASGISGYIMQKEWISALDARTRRPPESYFDHYDMNGKRVPEKEPFDVNGEKLMYPGDPKGSAGNIINCRCTVAIVPARDRNGDLIPTS